MNRILKLLLIWLMMAALPVQGMAAVLKLSCAPQHHAAAPEQHAGAGEHAGHAMHAHGAHHAAGMDMQAHDDGGQDAHQAAKSSSQPDTRCSACAACCFGAVAPPPALAWTPQPGVTSAPAIPTAVPAAEAHASGLERPPRPHSA